MGGQILTDNFKRHSEVILKLSDDPKYFPQVKKALFNSSNAYRVNCQRLADLGIKHLDEIGGLSYFKGKRGGPAGLFYKIANQEFEVSAPRKAAMGNLEAWLTKEHQKSFTLSSNEIITTNCNGEWKNLVIFSAFITNDNEEKRYESITKFELTKINISHE